MKQYLLPSDLDESGIAAAVDPGFRLSLGEAKRLAIVFLDTFDWRLHRAGIVLVEERHSSRRLRLSKTGSDDFVVPVTSAPRFAADLPDGHLAARAGSLVGVRALAEVGAGRVIRRDGRLENEEGDMVTRVRIETFEAMTTTGAPAAPAETTIRVDDSTAGLEKLFGARVAADHDLRTAAASRGRTPGDYSSKLDIRLDPDTEAETALRTILLDLLRTLEANRQGAIDDLDSEFLHDLRVACRRTRSALSQLKGVIPSEVTAPFNTEFKWLGSATGELRDLDVYLLEMPTTRGLLPPQAADDLEPLERLIRKSRARAHRTVVRALGSDRFRRLVAGWREVLDRAEPSTAPEATRPILALADKRITRAYRRILKRGRGLGDDPPAEALHRLRIDGKKLRYLLEFFRSLYPERELNSRIKELKRLQDILGGFNDMEVQRDRLEDFAGALMADRSVAPSCLLTLGKVAGILEQRQEAFRMAFGDAFASFSSRPVKNAYHLIFSTKEPL